VCMRPHFHASSLACASLRQRLYVCTHTCPTQMSSSLWPALFWRALLPGTRRPCAYGQQRLIHNGRAALGSVPLPNPPTLLLHAAPASLICADPHPATHTQPPESNRPRMLRALMHCRVPSPTCLHPVQHTTQCAMRLHSLRLAGVISSSPVGWCCPAVQSCLCRASRTGRRWRQRKPRGTCRWAVSP